MKRYYMIENSTAELAIKHFSEGLMCSEAILMAIAEQNNINSPLIPKIATAFGRGLANGDDMCGALSGGILALSLLQGRDSKEESFELLYENIAILKDKFTKEFREDNCTELLGFSLNDEDAKEKFVKNDCKKCKCSNYVGFVAKEVEELTKI